MFYILSYNLGIYLNLHSLNYSLKLSLLFHLDNFIFPHIYYHFEQNNVQLRMQGKLNHHFHIIYSFLNIWCRKTGSLLCLYKDR